MKRSLQMVSTTLLLLAASACGGAGASAPLPVANAFVARSTSTILATAPSEIAIDAGSTTASANWLADTDYRMVGHSGVFAVSKAIDTTNVRHPAPQAVYRTERYATHLSYAVANLTPAAQYTVRLHFVECYFHAARERIFDTTINGVRVLDNFDIFNVAGGNAIATVRQFSSRADKSGTITIAFDASVNNATVAGIEISQATTTATPEPTTTPLPAAAYGDGNLPPPGWQFPYDRNPFTIEACTSDPCAPPLDSASTQAIDAIMNGRALDLGDIYEGYPGDNDFPVYYASPNDPEYTVTCDRGGCGPGTIRVRIPNGAYASAGSDHHLAVIELAKGTETDFWEFNDHGTGVGSARPVSGGGSLGAGSAGVCTTTSFANNRNVCANSSTGSGLPVQPQILDPREILGGDIHHTLYVAIGCGRNAFAFPATHSDGVCTAGPRYGQRIWLDLADASIEALHDPRWAKTMLHAMHHYGWVVSDYNGAKSGMAFANLAPQSFTLWDRSDPWKDFFSMAGTKDFVTVPTTGISSSNIHVLAPCVNTNTC